MKLLLSSLFAGGLFGLGLLVSGMTQASKVFGFLDLSGRWDPSLALVMGGALAVYGVGYRLVRRRKGPLLASSFQVPSRSDMDAPLLLGAALFGVGWAVSGFCPGPALVVAGGGGSEALWFVPAMLAGMMVQNAFPSRERSTVSEIDREAST